MLAWLDFVVTIESTTNQHKESIMSVTLQQKLSAAVVEKASIFFDFMSRGFSVQDAFDKTFGDGAYNKLVSDLYDEFRAA